MTNIMPLAAELREKAGKGDARALRRAGKVPAIIYGAGKGNVSIALSLHDLSKYHRRADYSTLLMDIDVSGKKYQVLPRAIQLHPVTDVIEHADFIHVSENSSVKVAVHIHLINEEKCIGIKRGGVLNVVKREIELMCPPAQIPHRIDIDVAQIDIGASLHLNDIVLPANVKPVVTGTERNPTIITVVGRGASTDEAADSAEATPAK